MVKVGRDEARLHADEVDPEMLVPTELGRSSRRDFGPRRKAREPEPSEGADGEVKKSHLPRW